MSAKGVVNTSPSQQVSRLCYNASHMRTTFSAKHILVTGGTGFAGSHLIEELVNQKAHVVSTYQREDPYTYFESKGLSKKVRLVRADVENFEKMHDIITKFEIEYIFHLAAQPLVDVAYHNPKRTLYSNILGTINILESARLYPNIKGIIVASSDKAYGKLKKGKYKEDHPLRGDHPYEVSKSAADLICNSYFVTYGVPVVTTRFGNIYGEGDLNFSRIIPGMMKALIEKQPIELRSDGTFVRDYLYVKDVVDGYLLLAKNIAKAKGHAFNFGSEDTLSVLDLIHAFEDVIGKKIKYKILNNAKNEIPYQSLDYDKITEFFNWKPKYSVASTAGRIYQWYADLLI